MTKRRKSFTIDASTKMKWGSLKWFAWKFISQGYENPSAYYAPHRNGYQQYRHSCLAEYLKEGLPNILPGVMLDIGCGVGNFTQLVSSQHNFKDAIGTDFVYPVVQLAKKLYPEIYFTVARLPFMGFSKHGFDLIIASEVLYYLNEQDRGKALKEIHYLLKDHGLFFFSSALGDKYFSSQSAREFIETHFKIEKIWYDNNKLYHILMSPMNILNNLKYQLNNNTGLAQLEHSFFFINNSKLFNNPLFRLLLNSICFMTNHFIRNKTIPRVLGYFSKKLFPNLTKTNVTILSRKTKK